jgi:hypothetical protein
MKSKKTLRRQDYLRQGKALCGLYTGLDERGQKITTLACIKVDENKQFLVDVEVFLADVDIREQNLEDFNKRFRTLYEAISYLENELHIKFTDMHR